MRVLSIHRGADTAGWGHSLQQAFRRHPQEGIEFYSVVRSSNYIDYPPDLRWEDAGAHWELADVVHLHSTMRTYRQMGGDKPYIMHHHGTQYRNNPAAHNEVHEATGAPVVVSTHGLLPLGRNLTWAPQAHDLDWLATFRDHRPGKRLRVAHAPTNRAIKDTAAFLEACAKVNVEPVLIERQRWTECIRRKGTADVYYDQMQLGYGNNAIEAWAMGLPVIAGTQQDTLSLMQRDFGGTHPFLAATPATLADRLASLRDEAVLARWATVGQEHVRRWHDGQETVSRLAGLYRDAAGAVRQVA